MTVIQGWIRCSWHAPLVSPLGFLKIAGVMSLFYLLCALLGGREYTSFFSGTRPEGSWLALLLGLGYALSYFGLVLLVPILVLGAGFFTILKRLPRIRGRVSASLEPPPSQPLVDMIPSSSRSAASPKSN